MYWNLPDHSSLPSFQIRLLTNRERNVIDLPIKHLWGRGIAVLVSRREVKAVVTGGAEGRVSPVFGSGTGIRGVA